MRSKSKLLKFVWEQRTKLWVESNKLRAEGDKLRAKSNELWAETNELWAEAIIAKFGDVTIEWNNEGCIVDGKWEFTYEN